MRTLLGWAWLTGWWRQRGQEAAWAQAAAWPEPGPPGAQLGGQRDEHLAAPHGGPPSPRPDQVAVQAIAQARRGAQAPPAADQWEPF